MKEDYLMDVAPRVRRLIKKKIVTTIHLNNVAGIRLQEHIVQRRS